MSGSQSTEGASPPPASESSPDPGPSVEQAAEAVPEPIDTDEVPVSGQSPGQGPAERRFQLLKEQGLTEAHAEELSLLGAKAVMELQEHEDSIGMRTLVTFAALSRGDFGLADSVLSLPGEPNTPELKLLDLAARLYRACVGAERDPGHMLPVMNALTEALVPVMSIQTPEARLARGYAGLTLSEALLRVGDVGAARQQLEAVADEPGMAPGIAVVAGMLLGGIEQAVGRNDLALGHIQVALHRASQLGTTADEERLLRTVLVGLLMADSRRYGLAMLDDIAAGKYGSPPTGNGTVSRLYRLLTLIAQEPPFTLQTRSTMREQLRWLQGRHNSAGWSLLITSMVAGSLSGAGDICEAYGLLVETGAELRCRYMDGVADLCDRQIAALRHSLSPDALDELLNEAQRRRAEIQALQPPGRDRQQSP